MTRKAATSFWSRPSDSQHRETLYYRSLKNKCKYCKYCKYFVFVKILVYIIVTMEAEGDKGKDKVEGDTPKER